MRNGGFAGWCLITALLPGLGGCARVHEPPRAAVIVAGAKILEQEPLCVLVPEKLLRRIGEHYFLEAKDRAEIEPFIEAGLLQFVARPAGLPDIPDRLWYDVTPYGTPWVTSCLVNRNAYPLELGWGFRIGTPEIVKTYPLTVFTRDRCEIRGGAMFEYRMKLEPWFVPGRFQTNFAKGSATHYFDAAQNIGRAHVPYRSGDGKHWLEEKISYGHRLPVMCEKLG